MKPGRLLVVGSACVLTAAACAPMPTEQKTQLQTREFQTRTYQTSDVTMVMRAMLNVLQDEGYIVNNANTELGLLTASKEVDVEQFGEALLSAMLLGNQARWRKNSTIEVTANVSPFGSQCRVRANFQMKTFDNRGAVMEVKQIEEQQFYQQFFGKVDKGIFIQGEGL